MFMYSKLLIAYETTKFQQQMVSNIHVFPTGSQELTSDYDVAIVDPRNFELLQWIFVAFHSVHAGGTMSTFADTNFYLTPWFLEIPGITPNFLLVNSIKCTLNGTVVRCAVPFLETFAVLERHMLRKKFEWTLARNIHKLTDDDIQAKYARLSQIAEQLNGFYYHQKQLPESNYWTLLFEAQNNSIEAFTSTSAIAFVVQYLQNNDTTVQLPRYNLWTVLIEMVCQLVEHRGIQVRANQTFHFETVQDTPMFATAKYIYRIQEVLQKLGETEMASPLPLQISKSKHASTDQARRDYRQFLFTTVAPCLQRVWDSICDNYICRHCPDQKKGNYRVQ